MSDRRGFLKILFGGLSFTALATFVYPLVRFLSPSAGGKAGGTMTIPLKDVPLGGAKDVVFNELPIIVINRPKEGFIALSRVCTHLGCLVEYQPAKDDLLCPCHGGRFDLEGNVLSGPPPAPLAKVPVKVAGDNLIIG